VKFFYKIFLSMLLVLTVSLATIEYLTVSYSLEHALQREENTALSQHQMAKYSIQTVLLGITDDYTTSNMENIAKSAETPLGAQSGLFFASQNSQSGRDETVYYNSCKINPSDRIPATGILEYEIRETEKDRYLQVRSSFTLDTNSFVLVTEKNVKELFQDADTLRRRCEFFYWCILATGSFLVLVITFTLTKPLHRLQGTTRRFAKGEYDVRAEISSRDEIGDLSKTFNYMAKTIESKMEELKDAVRRQEEFTANFAHELKTPMTSIIGYADTLYQKTLSPEEVHQLAGIIMNEGMRLEALSFKLMELVTLSQSNFQLEEARIDEVIADAVETIQPTAEKRNVRVQLQTESAWVRLEYDLYYLGHDSIPVKAVVVIEYCILSDRQVSDVPYRHSCNNRTHARPCLGCTVAIQKEHSACRGHYPMLCGIGHIHTEVASPLVNDKCTCLEYRLPALVRAVEVLECDKVLQQCIEVAADMQEPVDQFDIVGIFLQCCV